MAGHAAEPHIDTAAAEPHIDTAPRPFGAHPNRSGQGLGPGAALIRRHQPGVTSPVAVREARGVRTAAGAGRRAEGAS
ncbi:hypothetical protein KN815_45050, partial [Streptomyces sp. 4503]